VKPCAIIPTPISFAFKAAVADPANLPPWPRAAFFAWSAFPRYNRIVLTLIHHARLVSALALAALAYCAAGCTAALGPGYTIEKQEIRVQFVPAPQPVIRIDSEYRLRNDGNQPLPFLELRLPGRYRFHYVEPQAEWDSAALAFEPSPANPRNVLLKFPQPWVVSSVHTLHLSVEYQPAQDNRNTLSFTPDAFFLPAEGWSPDLLPARGLLATGGVPPGTWLLTVRVPEGFLVHTSGRASKASRNGAEQTIRAVQKLKDRYPFVAAGRFTASQLRAGQETVNLWTRTPEDAGAFRQTTDALVRVLQAFDSTFGARGDDSHQLWLVECPVLAGCFTSATSNYLKLISEPGERASAEMASADTLMIDLSAGTPEIAVGAAPSLASSWLGYGQNPGFFEQDVPLSALPAFAASRGREAVQGPQVRAETIRRALRVIPLHAEPRKPEDPAVVRAKSFLFFYGLQDRYGPQVFSNALQHMLSARRGGGFDLDDLIAAFEQEAHQNVAQFVRLWMKHAGVPDDFRARYENSAEALTNTSKEIN
jgi:hypothetical protein